MKYRRLGRTNLKVSVIGIGGGAFYNPKTTSEDVSKIISYCVSNGVNFIDTAEDYDETKLKDGLKESKDKIILNSKSSSSNKEMMEKSIKNSLKRLGTDFIDIYQMQTLMELEDLRNRIKNGALDAIKEAKQQGKIKFIGFSSHRIPTIIEAIKTNEFDVVEMPYSIGQYESEKAIETAKKYNVGVIAINVLGGGILVDRNKLSDGSSFMTTKNAMEYVLSNDNVSTALIGMNSIEHVKENINAINDIKSLSDKEKDKIQKKVYEFLGTNFCRSCKACMPCDVHGWQFSIDNFLRLQAFYSKYKYKIFINEYQKLPIKADQCIQCGKCKIRCPYGVEIIQELKKTHEKLDLKIDEQDFKKLLKEYFDEKLIDEKILREFVINWDQLGRDVTADKINSRFMPAGKKSDQKQEEIGRTILAGMFYLSKNQFLEALKPYIGSFFLHKLNIKEGLSFIRFWILCGKYIMNKKNLKGEIIEREKIYSKIWGEWVKKALENIKSHNGIIINVGAGTGYYTIEEFSKNAKKIIAIEPEPRNLNLLRKNVAKHGLKNVYIVEKAAWNCSRKLKLYLSSVDMAGHSVVWRGEKAIEVQGDTLDNILAELGLEGEVIELIKINVEGAELEVLFGAKKCLPMTKRIVMQTHYKGRGKYRGRKKEKTTKDVEQFLRTHRFNVHTKIFNGITEDLVYGEKLIKSQRVIK